MKEQLVRDRVVAAALRDVGVPYRWAGNDPVKDGGLDCSGAVLRWMRAGGIHLQDMTAEDLRLKLPASISPLPGDLAFYGPMGKATHVVLVLTAGGKSIAGANGGGRPKPPETPAAYQARMDRARAGVHLEDHRRGGAGYRTDFLGFARLPVELAKPLPEDR